MSNNYLYSCSVLTDHAFDFSGGDSMSSTIIRTLIFVSSGSRFCTLSLFFRALFRMFTVLLSLVPSFSNPLTNCSSSMAFWGRPSWYTSSKLTVFASRPSICTSNYFDISASLARSCCSFSFEAYLVRIDVPAVLAVVVDAFVCRACTSFLFSFFFWRNCILSDG